MLGASEQKLSSIKESHKNRDMLNFLNVPNLESIGSLSLIGQENISQDNFPKLKTISGDLHLAMSGFSKLPDSLLTIEGDVFITQQPDSLIKSCLQKKVDGVIKGNIYLVGGKISRDENEKINYTQTIALSK